MSKFQLLPPLSTEEYERLEASIKHHGTCTIEVDENDDILDGHHRYEICQKHNIPLEIIRIDNLQNDLEKMAYVLKINSARRQMSGEQEKEVDKERKRVAKELYEVTNLDGNKVYTQDNIAGLIGVTQQAVSLWLNGYNTSTFNGSTTSACNASTKLKRVNQKIGKIEKESILDMLDSGATQAEVAAEFKVTRERIGQIKRKKTKTLKSIKDLKEEIKKAESRPVITLSNALTFLDSVDSFDLLLTDPPYLTDVDDINKFSKWLPVALKKLKSTGRAYVFIGAYPQEIQAYIGQAMPNQILVWTYRNTIGPDRAREYKSNWQAILYYIGKDAPPLKGEMLKEKFSVLDFNAPDGRHGKRWHAWEKPLDLAEHLILQSTNEGDIIIDPFAGTGTFLLAGGKLGRIAKGCDNEQSQIDIAIERGCKLG